MSNKILVTDSLFILDEHVKQLEKAGFEVERLDKPQAAEAELAKAVKGKVGYIMGGIEHVTKRVIDASDVLKVISWTGIGYKYFIPAWEYATKRGIAITNAPDGPTKTVAEWAIGAALLMNREFLELGKFGKKTFAVTKSMMDQNIGIIGLGRIGSRIAEIVRAFDPKSVTYYSRHRHKDKERSLNISYRPLNAVLSSSDTLFLCLSEDAGPGFIGKKQLDRVKDGALLVSFMHPKIIDENALFVELKSDRLRAISDHALGERFNKLPTRNWYTFKTSNTITGFSVELTSNMAVRSIINVLTKGNDQYIVNPDFRKYR